MSLRIGLLTFHHVINYGAMMQAYGLVDYLTRAGHDVEVIDYRFPYARRIMLRELARSRWHLPKMARDLTKGFKFHRFNRKHFEQSRTFRDANDLTALKDRYDLIIAGSDQIWNTHMFGFLPAYFLNFADPAKTQLASYAPSVGNLDQWGPEQDEVGKLLGRFHHLSARDEPTRQLVKQACGRDAKLVLDPTFIGNFDGLVDDAGPPIDEPYILGYYVGRPKPVHEGFERFKKRLGIKVLLVGDPSSAADETHIAVSPQRWLSYFKHARFVVTTSFHGSIFSILNRKPFAIPFRSSTLNRQADLLRRIGLEDRIIDAATELDAVDESYFDIDYDPVLAKLQELIADSRSYLDGVLESATRAASR